MCIMYIIYVLCMYLYVILFFEIYIFFFNYYFLSTIKSRRIQNPRVLKLSSIIFIYICKLDSNELSTYFKVIIFDIWFLIISWIIDCVWWMLKRVFSPTCCWSLLIGRNLQPILPSLPGSSVQLQRCLPWSLLPKLPSWTDHVR